MPAKPIKGDGDGVLLEKWCGEHKPYVDVCSAHGLRLYELHDEELFDDYALAAVFYCRVSFCDQFFCVADRNKSERRSPTEYFLSRHGKIWPIALGEDIDQVLAEHILKIRVRLKILYHKLAQREEDGK